MPIRISHLENRIIGALCGIGPRTVRQLVRDTGATSRLVQNCLDQLIIDGRVQTCANAQGDVLRPVHYDVVGGDVLTY